MSTSECMEYSQKYANAQSSKDRNEARGELRKQIDLTVAEAVAAERERIRAAILQMHEFSAMNHNYYAHAALVVCGPVVDGKPATSAPVT